jgi:CspA family cold shock protein
MITGTVKWFNKTKGYGFVTPSDGGKDIFVHISALEASGLDTLQEDQVVNMETEQGQKGPQATKVTIAE